MELRAPRPEDLDALHAINEACLPAVNSLTPAALERILSLCTLALVAEQDGRPVGLLSVLVEGTDHESRNYRWFADRFAAFAYVDRVCVAPEARSFGVGQALYAGALATLAGVRPMIGCEVNTRPPNPGSLRFHHRLGFTECGTAEHAADYAVVYLSRPL